MVISQHRIENKIEISTTTMQAEADYLSRMGAVGFAVIV